MLASKDVSPMASCRWVPGSYKELRSLAAPADTSVSPRKGHFEP